MGKKQQSVKENLGRDTAVKQQQAPLLAVREMSISGIKKGSGCGTRLFAATLFLIF